MNGPYGELIYEYTLKLTGITEFGASFQSLLEGNPPPAAGLRADIQFEGEVRGRLSGRLTGIDYLYVRPDGRMELNIKGVVETPTGARIALEAGGIGLPQPGSTVSLLRENIKLTTAEPEYAWVNPLEFWAVGEADLAKREVRIRGYLPQ